MEHLKRKKALWQKNNSMFASVIWNYQQKQTEKIVTLPFESEITNYDQFCCI